MPKYVRVIDENNEYITTEEEHNEMVAELQTNGFDYEGGIVDYANTIEELVDGYFVHNNGYSAEFHRSNIAKRTKGVCYAFIYVDEEPKVVAVWHKERKEWELL